MTSGARICIKQYRRGVTFYAMDSLVEAHIIIKIITPLSDVSDNKISLKQKLKPNYVSSTSPLQYVHIRQNYCIHFGLDFFKIRLKNRSVRLRLYGSVKLLSRATAGHNIPNDRPSQPLAAPTKGVGGWGGAPPTFDLFPCNAHGVMLKSRI